MARPVLPDSSWYISLFRSRRDPLHELSWIAEDREIVICGMVKAEVGRGIREPAVLTRYLSAWELMLYVTSEFKLWDKTLELAWELDRRGSTLPIQDIHIACCAMETGAVLLTFDKHFESIPGLDATDRIF